jgi:hypothetical protein
MSGFLHSVHVWLLSVWSHHPVTWQDWAGKTLTVTVLVGLLSVALFSKPPGDVLLTVAGLAAVVVAIGKANAGDAFAFWVQLAVALLLFSRPLWRLRTYLKKRRAQAAKVAPPKAKTS